MRLIDADALKAKLPIKEYGDNFILRKFMHILIDEQPTIENRPHGEWIPCTERLPERNELVLVSYKTGRVHLCEYLDDGSNNPWYSFKDGFCAYNNVVNAWMPLPEPYKKEGESK